MNGVIKTIVPLAPLCSGAQESLIGAVSAHRHRVVSQRVSCGGTRGTCRAHQEPELHRGHCCSRQDLLPQARKAQFQGSEVEGRSPFAGWLLSAESAPFSGGSGQFAVVVLKRWQRVSWKKKKKKDLFVQLGIESF